LEATFMPLPGCWLLIFTAVRRALAHRQQTPALLPPPLASRKRGKDGWGTRVVSYQLGQQCCPIQNMANSRRRYKGIASIFIAIATIEGPAPLRSAKVQTPKFIRQSSHATVRHQSGSRRLDKRNG
jgi:hypothetical protein